MPVSVHERQQSLKSATAILPGQLFPGMPRYWGSPYCHKLKTDPLSNVKDLHLAKGCQSKFLGTQVYTSVIDSRSSGTHSPPCHHHDLTPKRSLRVPLPRLPACLTSLSSPCGSSPLHSVSAPTLAFWGAHSWVHRKLCLLGTWISSLLAPLPGAVKPRLEPGVTSPQLRIATSVKSLLTS